MRTCYPCGRYAETQRKMCFREPVCQDESELPESAVPDCWGALWMQETPGLPACSAEIGEERHHVRLFRRSLAESREQLSFFLRDRRGLPAAAAPDCLERGRQNESLRQMNSLKPAFPEHCLS